MTYSFEYNEQARFVLDTDDADLWLEIEDDEDGEDGASLTVDDAAKLRDFLLKHLPLPKADETAKDARKAPDWLICPHCNYRNGLGATKCRHCWIPLPGGQP